MRRFFPIVVIAFYALSVTACASQSPLLHHTVDSDGHPVALWEKSAKDASEAILLVHGRTWSALPDFDLQVNGEQLSLMDGLVERGYAVFAVDLRGYGETPRDASEWLTPNRAADDVANVLDWIQQKKNGEIRPHLFGWSMGSTIAQLAVQRHPDTAASLTLYGYWRDDDTKLPADAPDIVPLRQTNTAAAAASDFILPGSISQNAIDTYVQAALAADPVRVDVRQVNQYNALDAAKLTVPTLIIVGAHDPIAPIALQTKLYERLGTGHRVLVTVPGGDHAAFLEKPREFFLHHLVAFWNGVRPTKPSTSH